MCAIIAIKSHHHEAETDQGIECRVTDRASAKSNMHFTSRPAYYHIIMPACDGRLECHTNDLTAQYASLATQIGKAARAEAPVRALKAISPNITKKRVPKPEPVPR